MKQKYTVRKGAGLEVEGDVTGVWGIDKREIIFNGKKTSRFILTHVPSGYMVEGARTKRFLTELIKTLPDVEELTETEVDKIIEAVAAARLAHGWDA